MSEPDAVGRVAEPAGQAGGAVLPAGSSGARLPAGSAGGQLPAGSSGDRLPAPVWVIAVVFVAVEIAVSGRYGFLQDELYFIEAGRHLALGYVDQPPLMPLLDKITDLFGITPEAVRVVPALAGGAAAVVAARCAALFGGGRLARVLAALLVACTPVYLGACHIANTTPVELLAWAVVTLCAATALLRERPRLWLAAGAAAGIGLQDNNLLVLLLIGLAVGLACGPHRGVLRTRWPWLGAAIAAAIWAPNLAWQAMHGWPQFAMATALHQENDGTADLAGGPFAQLVYAGVLAWPMLIAGVVRLWRDPRLRFVAIAWTLVTAYVLAWVPGRPYYTDGLLPAVLAAGAVAAERWIERARRPRLRRWLAVAAAPAGIALLLPFTLPLVPAGDVHALPASFQHSSGGGDEIGWPQLARAVAAQDAALARRGTPPTSIFTGYYAEAAAVQVLGPARGLPPVLSGHNAYWTWGPGRASDRTVLVVDALARLRPYFASCRALTTYHAPYGVRNDWTDLRIGICTGPRAAWPALWPRLRYYG